MTPARAGRLNHFLGRLGTSSDVPDVRQRLPTSIQTLVLIGCKQTNETRDVATALWDASKRPKRPRNVPGQACFESWCAIRQEEITDGEDFSTAYWDVLPAFRNVQKRP